jgi:hypothetical protein
MFFARHPHASPVRDSQGQSFRRRSLKTSVTVLFQSQQSFANVAVTADGVETISFLEAADGLMDLFGKNSPSILPSSPFSQQCSASPLNSGHRSHGWPRLCLCPNRPPE